MSRDTDDVVITPADVLAAGCEFELALRRRLDLLKRVTGRLGHFHARHDKLRDCLRQSARNVGVHAKTLDTHRVDLGVEATEKGLDFCRMEVEMPKSFSRPETVDELYWTFDELWRDIDRLILFYRRTIHFLRDRFTLRFMKCVLEDWDSIKVMTRQFLESLPRERIGTRNTGPAVVFEIL